MSNPTRLDYAGRPGGNCPICHERPVIGKMLFGHSVCKKCFYGFANRRQMAYLVDSLLFAIPNAGITFLVFPLIVSIASADWQVLLMASVLGVGLTSLFIMKDGFSGQSPGKRLTGVQVVDDATLQPISFLQSFKRNWFFPLGNIPLAGGFVTLAIIITIIIQMGKGPRAGDRYARTRVIWKKYADSPVFGGHGLNCRSCGYNLTGNRSGVCPECGTPATPEATIATT